MTPGSEGKRKATILRDALAILRKELRNVFRDRRAVFANYLLPLFLMPIIFTALGFFQGLQQEERTAKTYIVDIRNAPDDTFGEILSGYIRFLPLDGPELTDPSSTEWLTVVFPVDFRVGSTGTVSIHSDSTSNDQGYAAGMISRAVDAYEDMLGSQVLAEVGLTLNELDILQVVTIDTAPPESQGVGMLAMLLPYVIIIYIFAGSMGMGLDTTAGEKERGSLAALLVNQVSRTSIALGKIFFVIASGMINSTSSFLGLLIAFSVNRSFLGAAEFSGAMVLTPLSISALFLVLLVGSGVAASIIVLLGSLAKNMKEGSGYIMPVYIVVIVMAVVTMTMDTAGTLSLYLIPLVNVVFCLKGIILSQIQLGQLLVTVAVNALLISVIALITSRLYNSERILNTVT